MKIAMVQACDLHSGQSYGGKQCSLRNLDLLRCGNIVRSFSFSLTPPQNPPEGATVYQGLRGNLSVALAALAGRKVMPLRAEQDMLKKIRAFAPDLLWIDNSQLGRLLCQQWEVPTIVFFHNVEQIYARHKVENESLIYLPSYWASTYNEKKAVQKAQKLVCLNERDSQQLKYLYGRGADYILPISFGDTFVEPKEKKEIIQATQLLFVGSKFPPNVDGITWFVNEVMPLLPEFALKIVGRGFENLREKLQRQNVEVVGGVEQLEPYYRRSAAVVMPIRYGDGMKVKTAEAMMYGKTIFATDEALQGYDVAGLDGVYRCNTPIAFAQAIHSAAQEKNLKEQLAVRERFLEKYDNKAVGTEFSDFLIKVISEY